MQDLKVIQTKLKEVNHLESNLQEIAERTERAKIAVSKYLNVKIENEDTDNEVALIAKKLSTTYKHVEGLRKAITSRTDEVKKMLMIPEKELKEDLETLTLKRNTYATEKVKKQEEEARKIQAEQQQRHMAAIYETELIAAAKNGVVSLKNQTETYILNMYQQAETVETAKETLKKINVKPALKVEAYDKIFNSVETPKGLPQDVAETVKEKVKATYTHDETSKIYVDLVSATLEEWKGKFKTLITNLEKGQDQKAEKEKAAAEAKAKQQAESKAIAEAAELEKQEAEINASMEEALQVQQVTTKQKNTREYWSASINKMTAYTDLIAYFISQGGDLSKLDFLGKYAADNGRPEIKGVKYEKEIRVINK